MLLKFKNKHIFFAIENVWFNLDYKFKYLLNGLVSANPDDEYVQTIDIPENILLNIFRMVSSQPEGVAAVINQEMLGELIPQIMAAAAVPPPSGTTSGTTGTTVSGETSGTTGTTVSEATTTTTPPPPNEATRILMGINQIDIYNKTVKANKIINGRTQILG